MQKTLAELAELVGGELVDDKNISITGVNGINEATEGEISFVTHVKYIPLVKNTNASALIVAKDIETNGKPAIRVDNPSFAFSKIVSLFTEIDQYRIKGVHKTAIIGEGVQLGKDVAIGAYTVIEDGVKLGDGSIIYSGCFVGHHTEIGQNGFIYANVTIGERTVIGNNVIVHSGTVIGSDGFGFDEVEGVHEKIPQIGIVVIEDDVEIGANVAIDRARFDKTIIGKGTKIDNLVQIAHNVTIDEKCIIISQTGISGSVKIGKGVILAGQSGIAGHLSMGNGSIAAAQAGVTKSVSANVMVSGYPAREHVEARKVNAALQRLPIYVKTIQKLEKRIDELEKKIK